MSAPSKAYLERHACHWPSCGREGYISLRKDGTTVHSCEAHLRVAKGVVR